VLLQVVVVRFKLTLQPDSRITAFSGQSTTVPWVCTEKLRWLNSKLRLTRYSIWHG